MGWNMGSVLVACCAEVQPSQFGPVRNPCRVPLLTLGALKVIHDSQMSNLVAENTFLREKLGLKVPEQVTNIMFQNMV